MQSQAQVYIRCVISMLILERHWSEAVENEQGWLLVSPKLMDGYG
jgi:hypothetical protein